MIVSGARAAPATRSRGRAAGGRASRRRRRGRQGGQPTDAVAGSEPTSSSEEDEERRECEQLAPEAERDEGADTADVFDLEAEVLAEEAGQPAERQEDRRDHRQLLHHAVEAIRDG